MTPRRDQPLEYAMGKRWTTRYGISKAGSPLGDVILDFRIAGRETITVPAGTFDCCRIEASGVNRMQGRPAQGLIGTHWHAPDRVRSVVASEVIRRAVIGDHVHTRRSARIELVSFEQG